MIQAGAVIWAAGVAASAAADWLHADRDRAGRVKVAADLTLPGREEILVIGDTAAVADEEGKPVPGIAPAAKQMGRYAARVIAARVNGTALPGAFRYRHQGDLATIGRKAAVVKLAHLTLTGFWDGRSGAWRTSTSLLASGTGSPWRSVGGGITRRWVGARD